MDDDRNKKKKVSRFEGLKKLIRVSRPVSDALKGIQGKNVNPKSKRNKQLEEQLRKRLGR